MPKQISPLTKAQQKIITKLKNDAKMQEAIGLHIGRDINTIRQWAFYRPWLLFENPAALQKAEQYIKAHVTYKKATA